MHQTVVAGALAALLFSANLSFAQQSAQTPPPPPGQEAAEGPSAAPPPPPGPRGPEDAWGERGQRFRPMGRRPPPPPPPSPAAHFRIEDGGMKIDIKCADNEPMKTCADIVVQILDRMGGGSDR